MTNPTLPPVRQFIDAVRSLYASGLVGMDLWEKIRQQMQPLLADPQLRDRAQAWPATVESAPTVRNLLFYEDPDFGFVLNATVRAPDMLTHVHDHGDVWTLYGLIEGHETMYRYARTDDNPRDAGPAVLTLVSSDMIGPGDIDVVRPGEIHQERGGDVRSISFIVRGQRPGTFHQRYFDTATGAITLNNGPALVPYALS